MSAFAWLAIIMSIVLVIAYPLIWIYMGRNNRRK